jgi:hypothetical protein
MYHSRGVVYFSTGIGVGALSAVKNLGLFACLLYRRDHSKNSCFGVYVCYAVPPSFYAVIQ